MDRKKDAILKATAALTENYKMKNYLCQRTEEVFRAEQ